MTKASNTNYDLDDRTFIFAQQVRNYAKRLPKTVADLEDGKQVTRSSGSIGANYIEANEALSKKDFQLRIKICRKEAKETEYRLKLLDIGSDNQLGDERMRLLQEAKELRLILSSILNKSQTPNNKS